ncbi:MAG TPA: response regulator [Oculatellaceae cyanobacterium]|jgi:chemotaxis family two-component system response regulator PixH
MNIVLVVEDSATDLEVISLYLKQAGLSVVVAKSSQEAQEIIDKNQPNLIILDVILPDQSGFELCRELKNNPITNKIPVVISSSKNTDVDKLWGNMLGADAYIAKPVDKLELIQTIQTLMV